jgi:hypothetical protein
VRQRLGFGPFALAGALPPTDGGVEAPTYDARPPLTCALPSVA